MDNIIRVIIHGLYVHRAGYWHHLHGLFVHRVVDGHHLQYFVLPETGVHDYRAFYARDILVNKYSG